jgi:hypothetical protein
MSRALNTSPNCIVAAVAALGTLASPTTARAFSAADPARILYVGDSIAVETRDTVKWWTQIGGKATLSDSMWGGLAICDFLEGKPEGVPLDKKLKEQVRTLKPHLVILQFWGNAFTKCMEPTRGSGGEVITEAYYNQYFWDALNAVQQIRDGAAAGGIPKPRILWVLQGPDRGIRERPQRLNQSYAYAAAQSNDRTSDAGYDVSLAAYPYPGGTYDRYGWTQYLPCTTFEQNNGLCTPSIYGDLAKLHADNDPTHFCLGNASNWGFTCGLPSPGIVRYGMRIAHDANTWLGI